MAYCSALALHTFNIEIDRQPWPLAICSCHTAVPLWVIMIVTMFCACQDKPRKYTGSMDTGQQAMRDTQPLSTRIALTILENLLAK